MKLTQLEYFCVAARYHNITKAAKELFVTQPSISNAIRALEEEFGVNLFFRNNNKLTLTPEGELFYKSAEELLAHADSVESEFLNLFITKKIADTRSTIFFSVPRSGLIFDTEFCRIKHRILTAFLLFFVISQDFYSFWCKKCDCNDICPCHKSVSDITHCPYSICIYNCPKERCCKERRF